MKMQARPFKKSTINKKSLLATKKRVSFAPYLEDKRIDDDADAAVSPTSSGLAPSGKSSASNMVISPVPSFKKIRTPLKSNAKTKISDDFPSHNEVNENSSLEPYSSEEQEVHISIPKQLKKKPSNNHNQGGKPVKIPTFYPMKKNSKIRVKRSTKELLLNMNKKERRQFIRKLKERKDPENYSIFQQSKSLWEKIRSSNTEKEERESCIEELIKLVQKDLKKIIYKHDLCRIVQCLLALKRENIRTLLFDELTPEIVRMAKDKYANFFVRKMLKYGTRAQKDIVINAFKGHCISIFRVIYGARILEVAYNDWASADQRNFIVSEFYGPEFVIFRNETPSNELTVNFIAKKFPEKIPVIMANLEEILQSAVQKIQNLKHSLFHKLLFDFVSHCTLEQRKAMVDSLKDQLPEICHTREGSRAALICIWSANDSNEQKAIVKSFTGLVINCCKDEFARRTLFGIFDFFEDSERVIKTIVKVIADNLSDVIYDRNGIWVLHYLVHPRDYRVFGKGMIEILAQGEELTGKTPASDRYQQYFECLRDPLLDFIGMAANMRDLLNNKITAVLVLDTLEPSDDSDLFLRQNTTDKKVACFRAIAEIVADEFIPHPIESPPHIIEKGPARFVLRKLLQADPKQSDVKLSDFIAELPAEHIGTFVAINPGCFALIDMARSGSEKARSAVLHAVNLNQLKNSSLVGANALLSELEESNSNSKRNYGENSMSNNSKYERKRLKDPGQRKQVKKLKLETVKSL